MDGAKIRRLSGLRWAGRLGPSKEIGADPGGQHRQQNDRPGMPDQIIAVRMREAHGEIAQAGRGQPAKACSEAGRQRRATTEHVGHRNGRKGALVHESELAHNDPNPQVLYRPMP